MWLALALSAMLVAYNNVANRWPPFHGAAYVPVNLAFAGAILAIAAGTLSLSRGELGLRGDVADAGVAMAAIAVFAIGALAFARSRHGHRIADKRVEGRRGGALAFYVLVRIPLGTAVAEEVLFRGVLFAAWRDAGLSTVIAALCAAAAFGLWHVAPTLDAVRLNNPAVSHRALWTAVMGAVLLTTGAGLGFTLMRLETEGLVAPIVLHAGINSMGALAAAVASRRKPAGSPA